MHYRESDAVLHPTRHGMRLAFSEFVDSLLVFKAVTFSVIGLCALTGLAALMISAKKERALGPPLRGALTLAFVVAGLCTALALLFAYQLQKQTSETLRLERVRFETKVAASQFTSIEDKTRFLLILHL
jgi:multisubunit Na+/H+ antiporter MnhC subunit